VNELTIYYSGARCGAGKTDWIVASTAQQPGRSVIAVDRREVMDGLKERLDNAAMEAGHRPVIDIIRSPLSSADIEGTSNVRRDFRMAADKHRHRPHVIVIVTHEALRGSDLTGFTGWDLYIDEVPSIIDMAECCTPAQIDHFAACYRLVPVTPGVSQIVATENTPTVAMYAEDQDLSEWVSFRRRVGSEQGVFTNLTDWTDMAGSNHWQWWSIWSPYELSAFNRIVMVGNAFMSSLTAKVIQHNFPQVELKEFHIGSRPWQPRNVTIRYFADNHVAGSNLWFGCPETKRKGIRPVGEICPARWMDWVRNNTDHGQHVWTSNVTVAMWLTGTDIPNRITPKVAGSNKYRDRTVASIIYSSKVRPTLIPVYRALGIEPEDVVRAQEHEDIAQFAMRTSLRMPNDDRAVEIRVYDYEQASILKRYLEDNYPFAVALVYQDIGINHIVKARPGPKVPERTQSEQAAHAVQVRKTNAEKAKERRDAEKAAKIAAGTYKPRGRPKGWRKVKDHD
jgi:hypothetical protein